jgi:2-hydroxychromene-2-carboxylate isomerase
MEAALAADAELEMVIADNQAQLEAAGHWGVPTFVYNGSPYFGQDRIDTLCWQLERDGFKK